jgi:hypothetical protein
VSSKAVEYKEHLEIEKLSEALKGKEKTNLNLSEINTVLMNLVHRRRFNYTGRDIAEFVLRCLCFRKKKNKHYEDKELWVQNVKKHYLFGKGVHKMNHELDVLNLLRTMRRVKLLSQTLLT